MSQKSTGSFNLREVLGSRWRGAAIILKTAADCDPGLGQGSGFGLSTSNVLRDAGILEVDQVQNRFAARPCILTFYLFIHFQRFGVSLLF